MSSLATLFEPPDDATAEDLRGRLRAMADLVARAPVPIAVAHDADCRFISANDALGRLLGVPPEVNISMTPRAGEHPLYRIQHNGRDLPPNELPMQYAIAHRTHVTNDIEIVRADASVVYVQNDVEPLYDRRGQVCGCVSVCVDLTDRRRVEMVLREADRRKDEFLATLSHELRNPLAPIRNAVELMRRAGHDPHIAERALAIMERQLHQLVRLTDDLLDVSRITRDTIELRRDRIDLRAVLRSALETIDPLSHAAGHDLTVDLPQTALWVYADFTRLAQAFVNLLNNAVKYTDRGGHISLDVLVEGGGAVVSLRDTGIGIEPALLPRIFDMFVQIDPGSTRARSGLGIGLALTRRLIELHEGSIEARSDGAGAGTTFVVRLPLVAAAERHDHVDELVPTPTASRCRVLVAEDIPDAAEMMRMMIDCMGHDVRVATDGIEAVAIAEDFSPQIALLDIGMPRMDGYEAARRIRLALGNQVMLVALTGWGQEDDQRRAFAAGFDRHLTKPAEPDVLEDLIASAMH
ncbi:MAG TPA: ATP-binding protein [Vicinamibacterales bacterium]|jgi:signal transduction histidine kinase/CheY-like chemotaxis protein|nr:ATP-binding protein [Vicinamibacterales bacterium]